MSYRRFERTCGLVESLPVYLETITMSEDLPRGRNVLQQRTIILLTWMGQAPVAAPYQGWPKVACAVQPS